jgi:hypothetical protein
MTSCSLASKKLHKIATFWKSVQLFLSAVNYGSYEAKVRKY